MTWLLSPKVWIAIAFAAVLAFAGWQTVQVADGKTTLAEERQARAQETSDRNRVALRESERVAALQITHAANQQEIVDVYTQIVHTLETGRADDASRAERVRHQFAASAARDREASRANPAACERLADRSESLGQAAAEGGQLLGEARRAIAGRDAEVTLLLGIVRNDRALLAPADYSLMGGKLPRP
jgi:hypothetical protein